MRATDLNLVPRHARLTLTRRAVQYSIRSSFLISITSTSTVLVETLTLILIVYLVILCLRSRLSVLLLEILILEYIS